VAFIFDLHCDTPINIHKKKFNHIKPEKLWQHNYWGAIFAHFIHPKEKHPFVEVVRLISSTTTYVNKIKQLHIVYSSEELIKNKVNIMLGVEGGHIFDKTFRQVEALYGLGVRVFTITWNNSNRLAHSALAADKKGLTKRGREFIKKLADFDIIIDLSHASTRTVLDVCEICANPVMASHSCVRTLKPKFLRNIDDRAIKAIAQKNGVIGINFSRYHLGGYRVIDHLDYLRDNFCVDVAAIGSDFDGINDPVISGPKEVRGLEKELFSNGYKRKELDKIFYKNFLRVLKKVDSG